MAKVNRVVTKDRAHTNAAVREAVEGKLEARRLARRSPVGSRDRSAFIPQDEHIFGWRRRSEPVAGPSCVAQWDSVRRLHN